MGGQAKARGLVTAGDWAGSKDGAVEGSAVGPKARSIQGAPVTLQDPIACCRVRVRKHQPTKNSSTASQVRNDVASDGLDLARRRIKKLEDAKDAAEAKADLSEEVEALVKRNASEVVREAARLNEVLVQLRLERGKLMREEVLLREKVRDSKPFG